MVYWEVNQKAVSISGSFTILMLIQNSQPVSLVSHTTIQLLVSIELQYVEKKCDLMKSKPECVSNTDLLMQHV